MIDNVIGIDFSISFYRLGQLAQKNLTYRFIDRFILSPVRSINAIKNPNKYY